MSGSLDPFSGATVEKNQVLAFGGHAVRSYVAPMDWQQSAALAIVAVTGGLFVRARWRRRTKLSCASHCGCPAAANPPRASVVYRARKGERPEIVVKMH